MKPAILIVGATGVFGERLARRLALWGDIDLVLAARNAAPLGALADALGARWVRFDRNSPDPEALKVFCVVDCAGPFQASDYRLAEAALAAGAHYVDIADGRAFVDGFAKALNRTAVKAGRVAITGASSTPALSHAALDDMTAGWTRIDSVRVAISPAGRTPQGLAVIRAILSWTGAPLAVFTGGGWTRRPGWSQWGRIEIPGLGRRRTALADTPDLDLLAARYGPRSEALFLAGLESGLLHNGLWALSLLVRWKIVRSLAPYARPLQLAAGLVRPFGSPDGGMVVLVRGADAQDRDIKARFNLIARKLEGPYVPILAAAAVVRRLLQASLEPGARPAAGVLGLDEILAQTRGLAIETGQGARLAQRRGLFPRLLGPRFDALPPVVRRVHAGEAEAVFEGRAVARGDRGLAGLARLIAGLRLGRFSDFRVSIRPVDGGEIWTRQFGRGRFASRISDDAAVPGLFEERLGPLRFRLEARATASGFRWLARGLRLGPLPVPAWLTPTIRARSFARDGAYRFAVCISHPLTGVIVAYAGRLNAGP